MCGERKQGLHMCNMIIYCVEGLRQLDQEERGGSHAARSGIDQPSAVFRWVCTGLFF